MIFKEFKTLLEMLTVLPDDESCRKHFELIRWDDGIPACPACSSKEHYALKSRGVHKGLYKCGQCNRKYTVSVGTMFESSHVGFRKWYIAIYLFQAHKKGISSIQLSKDIGTTQRTAWFMLHRIRHSMTIELEEQLEGTVELDETFVGGKNKNRHNNKKVEQSQGRSFKDKTPVMGMLQEAVTEIIERPNKNDPEKTVKEKIYHKTAIVKCQVIANTKSEQIQPVIRKNVKPNSILVSDEWIAYRGLSDTYDHRIVDHRARQYVNEAGDTSNALEGFWTWLKRSYVGIYHNMSGKHLQAYCEEHSFRYATHRMKDRERFDLTLQLSTKKRITYKALIGKETPAA